MTNYKLLITHGTEIKSILTRIDDYRSAEEITQIELRFETIKALRAEIKGYIPVELKPKAKPREPKGVA